MWYNTNARGAVHITRVVKHNVVGATLVIAGFFNDGIVKTHSRNDRSMSPGSDLSKAFL